MTDDKGTPIYTTLHVTKNKLHQVPTNIKLMISGWAADILSPLMLRICDNYLLPN